MANVMRITGSPQPTYTFRADAFPAHPGCYLMKGEDGTVIYVGKANSLRNRLASYFRVSAAQHRKAEMIAQIRDIEVILVRNEREALVLESNLVRHHDPGYNSRFTRDDDSYYYIAVTDETFPRIVPYRKRRTNFALDEENVNVSDLYGPYVGWRLRNRILDAVRDECPVRTCHVLPERPCPRHKSGRCPAPCIGAVSSEDYARTITSARRLLRRPSRSFLRALSERMSDASAAMEFERARELRDRLRALEHAALPQAVERHRPIDLDALYVEDGQGIRLSVRSGAMVSLDGPVAFGEGLEGIAWCFERIDASVASGHLVVSGDLDWQLLRDRRGLRVSKPGPSYPGQLLEICRINHAYRTGDAAPGSEPSTTTDRA